VDRGGADQDDGQGEQEDKDAAEQFAFGVLSEFEHESVLVEGVV
jgi:hypothetical protein